jgi:hypothetical protein
MNRSLQLTGIQVLVLAAAWFYAKIQRISEESTTGDMKM